MTLADFARLIGVTPATARQWKKRGKIVEKGGGFEVVAEAQREWAGLATRDAGVTEYGPDSPRPRGISALGMCDEDDPRRFEPVTVASQWEDVTQPESVTTVTPWPYEPLPLVTDCPTCHGPRWACGCTPIEKLTQVELLTKDNRILSDAVDSLRDLTTEQGRKLSDLQRRIEALESDLTPPAPDFTSNTGTPPSWLKGSNYSGSRNDLGEPYFD